MRVKRYVVRTLPEALEKIRFDLGKDAIILNTKKIKTGGFFGLFRREQIEVIAAVDRDPINGASPVQSKPIPSPQKVVPLTDRGFAESPKMESERILQELREMRGMFQQLVQKGNADHLPPVLKQVHDRLRLQEVDEGIIAHLIEKATKHPQFQNLQSEQVLHLIENEIAALLKKRFVQGLNPFARLYHFVGPTGVGKTTTIAKLAAESVIKQNKKVGLITSDTYRIAAIDQLKTYANILNAPLEVVFNTNDLHQSVMRLAGNDLILMDTAGRNYRNLQYLQELHKLISSSIPSETFLVLSLTSKYSDMKEILRQFEEIGIQKVIFTKIDETTSYGSILNLMYYHNLQLSYITNGQNVPDDIELANPDRIAQLIVRGENHE